MVGVKIREELKKKLEIDPDDLDQCLIDHSNLLYQVGEACAEAVAEYDGLKLTAEEMTAIADENLRKKMEVEGKKLTETALKHAVCQTALVNDAERSVIAAKLEVGKWEALKEAFHRRSYMLQKLVDMKLSQLGALSVERGVSNTRRELTSVKAEANKVAISEIRRNSRFSVK